MLRVCFAKGDVAARRIIRCEREQQMIAGAVIDPRWLEEKPVRRAEEMRQSFYGREVARQVDVRKCGRDDERGNQQ